jgi:hypothetical protein
LPQRNASLISGYDSGSLDFFPWVHACGHRWWERLREGKLTRMRAIWKGAISFGLVNIPVSLFPALRREELKFRLLRASDQSPVNYKRVAEADGKEVPWDQIVKGYEHEKGKFVVLKDEDFARVDVEATQTVDILHFVKLSEVNPLLFNKPYYMEATKGGEKPTCSFAKHSWTPGRSALPRLSSKPASTSPPSSRRKRALCLS